MCVCKALHCGVKANIPWSAINRKTSTVIHKFIYWITTHKITIPDSVLDQAFSATPILFGLYPGTP